MLTSAHKVLRFGRFTLDPNTASLSHEERQLSLRPKSFDVLLYLARNPGRVVSKDELIEAVWPNIFVTENSLVQCVSEIRAILDDDAQKVLKTIARRGYLFAAAVSEVEQPPGRQAAQAVAGTGRRAPADEAAAASHPGSVTRRLAARHLLAVVAAGLVVLAAAGAVWLLAGRPGSEPAMSASPDTARKSAPLPDRVSIAVLPFDGFGGDADAPALGDALADVIISSLSKLPAVFVIARNSTFAYKGRPMKVQTVANELGVRYLLEGSVQKLGSKIRITAQLIDASTGFHRWSEIYDREIDDIFALQDEITLTVVTALQINLTQGELARVRRRGTNNLRAWLLVNQSFEHLVRFTKEDNELARELAEEAIALDPSFPEAYVRLGRTHLVDFHSGWVANPADSLRRSIELVQQALALDDTYPDTYHLLSAIYLYLKRHDDARLAVAKALALSPNHSLAKANLGMILTYSGEPEAAIGMFEEAMRLSPIYPGWYSSELARAYFLMGRYDQAVEALQRRLRGEPNSGEALVLLAASESAAGRLDRAKAALDRFLAPRAHYTLRHYASGEFYKNPEDLNRVLAALHKAGLPE